MSAGVPKPPATLSALLALAVGDMEQMVADGDIVPDSGIWWRMCAEDRRCHACLAGAVIAGTLGHGVADGSAASIEAMEAVEDGDWWLSLRMLDAWTCGHGEDVRLRMHHAGMVASVADAAPVLDILGAREEGMPTATRASTGEVRLAWVGRSEAERALRVLSREVRLLAEAGL